jgi:hypothetical protein
MVQTRGLQVFKDNHKQENYLHSPYLSFLICKTGIKNLHLQEWVTE